MNLPNYLQESPWACGPTCVKITCAALGKKYQAGYLEERLLCTQDEGVEPRSISAFLRSEGYSVLDGNFRLEDLSHFVKSGAPVICLVDIGGGHYVTVGDVSRGYVRFQDPSSGPQKLKIEAWEATWRVVSYCGSTLSSWGIAVWK